jgi:hypothetical protein
VGASTKPPAAERRTSAVSRRIRPTTGPTATSTAINVAASGASHSSVAGRIAPMKPRGVEPRTST